MAAVAVKAQAKLQIMEAALVVHINTMNQHTLLQSLLIRHQRVTIARSRIAAQAGLAIQLLTILQVSQVIAPQASRLIRLQIMVAVIQDLINTMSQHTALSRRKITAAALLATLQASRLTQLQIMVAIIQDRISIANHLTAPQASRLIRRQTMEAAIRVHINTMNQLIQSPSTIMGITTVVTTTITTTTVATTDPVLIKMVLYC